MQNKQLTYGQEESKIIWNQIKDKVQVTISRPSYETWIKETTASLNENSLTIYFKNEFQQEWVEKSYKDLILHIAKELTENTYELQFELKSNTIASNNGEKSKSTIDNIISKLEKHLKVTTDNLKSNDIEDSDKRIQALEGKIVKLENVIDTLVGKLEVVELKTQLEK